MNSMILVWPSGKGLVDMSLSVFAALQGRSSGFSAEMQQAR